ncbi:MAG TPA: hypothetical protein VF807_14560 [Ktedonobacterales bacterium]
MDNSDSRLPSGEFALDWFTTDISLEHHRKEPRQRRVIHVVGYCPLEHVRHSLNVAISSLKEPCVMPTLAELQDLIMDNHESIVTWVHAPQLSISAFILPLDDPQAREFIANETRPNHKKNPFWPNLQLIIWLVPHGCVVEDIALHHAPGVTQSRVLIGPREPEDQVSAEIAAVMQAEEIKRKVMAELEPLLSPRRDDMRRRDGGGLPS